MLNRIKDYIQAHEAMLRVFFIEALFGIAVSWVAYRAPEAINLWRTRAPIRALAQKAERYGITYEDVIENPKGNVGKPVKWFLTHPNSSEWLYNGNAQYPVLWKGRPPEMVETGQSGGYHGGFVVATVVKVVPWQGIMLMAYSIADMRTVTSSFRVTN